MGQPSTSSSLTAPEPGPPVGWSAPHRCSQENAFISDPKQEGVKGEGVGTRWLSTEVGAGLDFFEQIMSALDCPYVK